MTKRYFEDLGIAKIFAKQKGKSVFATSSIWQKRKGKTKKKYVVKW